MTKRFSTPASFNPMTGQIDGSNIPYLNPAKVLAIIDTTARAYLYDIVTPGLGYSSVSGALMTVEVPTGNLSADDNILVIWDDELGFDVSDAQSAPISGSVPMTVDQTYAPQRWVKVTCTQAGFVEFQLADGSTTIDQVFVGIAQTFGYACIKIVGSGTTAVATYENLK